MAVVKSEIIKQLKKSYPNFENKILSKIVEIIIKEIKDSLKRSESFELRGLELSRTKFKNHPLEEILKLIKKLVFHLKEL